MTRRTLAADVDVAPPQLSDVLQQDFRVVAAQAVVIELCTGSFVELPRTRRAVMHLLLDGVLTVKLDPDASLELQAGDNALLFYGDRHSVGDHGRGAVQAFCWPRADEQSDQPPVVRIGSAPVRTTILSCALELSYIPISAAAIRAAPALWPMRASAGDSGVAGGLALTQDLTQLREALRGPGATAFATALMSLLLVHSMRDLYRTMWHDRAMEIRAPATRRLAAALRSMHTHPDWPWTVARLAQEVGLSRSSFAALFSSSLGMAPVTYLNHVRMRHAAELLKAGAIPLAEVAQRSGYVLVPSFTRAFAAFHGVSASQYAAGIKRAGGAQQVARGQTAL